MLQHRFAFVIICLLSLSRIALAMPDEPRSVSWGKVSQEMPRSDLDVEVELQRELRDLKRQGAKPDVTSLRHWLEQERAGTRQCESQTWSTDGKGVRKEFSYGEPVAFPRPATRSPLVKGHVLERDGLCVQVTTYSQPSAVRHADVSYSSGEAMLRPDERGNALRSLLLGNSPKIYLTSPHVVERNATPEGTALLLKKTMPLRFYGKPVAIPSPLRITLSRDGERLLRIERLGHRSQESWETTTTQGWEQIKAGVWLPSRIRVVSYNRSANGTRQVSRTETYRRIRVAVGKAVDVAPLKEPFFSGRTSVRDHRFDSEYPDVYSADRAPLSEIEAQRRYEKRRREKVLSVLLPQWIGVLALGGFVVGLIFQIRRGNE